MRDVIKDCIREKKLPQFVKGDSTGPPVGPSVRLPTTVLPVPLPRIVISDHQEDTIDPSRQDDVQKIEIL